MDWRALIVDGYDRLPDLVTEVLAGVRPADLDWQPYPEGNSLGWTAWHLTRVQDSQLAELMGREPLWTQDGWSARFRRPADPDDTGYGHTPAEVRAFRSPSARVQLDYLRATVERTKTWLASLPPAELDRELDEPWQRPLPTVAVRIVSVLADCHQHAGEASYIRGLLRAARRRRRARARTGTTRGRRAGSPGRPRPRARASARPSRNGRVAARKSARGGRP
jgi:hypothetical protein